MGRARSITAASSAVLCLLIASGTRAQEERPRATLSYEVTAGASSCPDEDALREGIATRLGYDPFTPDAELRVRIAVMGDGDGLAARVEVERPGRERAVRELDTPGDDCRELAEAITLAASIAIDPASLTRPAAADDEPEAAEPPVARAPEPVAAPPAASSPGPPLAPPPPSPGATVGGMAGVLGAFGSAPSAAFGLTVGLDVEWPGVRLGIGARAHLPSGDAVDEGEVSAALYALDLAPCMLFGPAWACGLLVVGAVSGDAQGFAETTSVTAPYFAAGGRVGLSIDLGERLSARLWLDATAQLARTTLLVDDVEAWEMPLWSVTAGAALAIPFS